MYGKIIIVILLSGYISTPTADSDPQVTTMATPGTPESPETLPTEEGGTRKQIDHPFSEPVITVIILGVMAGIIGTILLIAYCIGQLRRKTSPGVQPEVYLDDPLSSVQTENLE